MYKNDYAALETARTASPELAVKILKIDPDNTGSAKALERLGFVREGLLRQRWEINGVVSDSALYGLLAQDRPALWSSISQGLECWHQRLRQATLLTQDVALHGCQSQSYQSASGTDQVLWWSSSVLPDNSLFLHGSSPQRWGIFP